MTPKRILAVVASLLCGIAPAVAEAGPLDCHALFVSSFVGGPYQSRVELDTGVMMSLPLNELEGAESLVCGPDGLVYVGLSGGQPGGSPARQIVRYDQQGENLEVVLDFALVPDLDTSGGPEGLTFAPGGDLFFNTRLGDGGFDPTGVWKLPKGSATPVHVMSAYTTSNAEATAVLAAGQFEGHLIAADYAGNRVVRVAPPFDAEQVPVDFIAAVACPNGIAIAKNGDVYVASECTGTITRFSPDGLDPKVLAVVGDQIRKITFDPVGNIYGATVEGPLLRFAPDGTVTTICDVHEGNGVGVCARPDTDGDGFCDVHDVCPSVADPDQLDTDGDGIGDACPDEGCGCRLGGEGGEGSEIAVAAIAAAAIASRRRIARRFRASS